MHAMLRQRDAHYAMNSTCRAHGGAKRGASSPETVSERAGVVFARWPALPLVAQAVDVPMREYPGGNVCDSMSALMVRRVIPPPTWLAEWAVGLVFVFGCVENAV